MLVSNPNFKVSKGSWLVDTDGTAYFDLAGMYSSLALGYSHPCFKTPEFREKVHEVLGVKVSRSLVDHTIFRQAADALIDRSSFDVVHFSPSGSLAVSAALKLALNETPDGQFLYLDKSFHGIYGLAVHVTDRVGEPGRRLTNCPGLSPQVSVRTSPDSALLCLDTMNQCSAVIVETIRCTQGDLETPVEVLRGLRRVCDARGIPLIFDEVQTGFYSTGTMWHYQKLGVVPDILVFGKKAQMSGIMARGKWADLVDNRLSCTFDGDLIDALTMVEIIRVVETESLLEKFNASTSLLRDMCMMPDVEVRGQGGIIGLVFESTERRDWVREECINSNLLVNTASTNVIRLRPHLAFTEEDAEVAGRILRRVMC